MKDELKSRKARNVELAGTRDPLSDVKKRTGLPRPVEAIPETALMSPGPHESLFQTIFNSSPTAIAVLRGPELVYELVNPAFQAIAPGKAMIGRTHAEVWPELAGQDYAEISEVRGSDGAHRAVDFPLRIRRAPDAPLEERFFSLSYSSLVGIQGWSDSILVTAVETTAQVQTRRRAEALQSLANDLNSERGLQKVMWTAMVWAAELLGGEDGALFLFEEDGRHLTGAFEMWPGDRAGTVVEIADWPHVEEAANTKKPVCLSMSEARGTEAWWFRHLGISRSIVAPLVSNGRCVGVLFVNFRREDCCPTPEDLAFAEAIAGQCGLAIERARAYDDVSASKAHQELLLSQLQEINEQLTLVGVRERGLADEAQRRAAELDATFTSMPDAVVIYGCDGEILRMNPAAEKLLGYTPERRALSLSERMKAVQPKTERGRPLRPEDTPVSRALRGDTLHGETILMCRGESRVWVSVSGAPIRNPEGDLIGAVVAYVDVTTERELHELRDDLVRAISHDLRSPLTAIMGQAQMVERACQKVDPEGSLHRHAEAIVVGARRMNAMIQDLVDSTRLESMQLNLDRQQVDTASFVSDLLDRSPALESDRVEVCIPADLPAVDADPNRLERILTNLLGNALKYSPVDTLVTVGAQSDNGEVRVWIADRGRGIAAEDLPHLFERFYRAKGWRKTEGLGLGLYITRMFVEAH